MKKILNALMLIVSNPDVYKNIIKHYYWYLELHSPERFIQFDNAIKNKEEIEKQNSMWRDMAMDGQKKCDSYKEECKKLELQVIHLKDLIQARDLIITKLESKLC